MSWKDQDWVRIVSFSLKLGLVIALVYVGAVFLQRYWADWEDAGEPRTVELHEDLYVHPKRTYISSFGTAKSKLAGRSLWVKEGWRWACDPGERLLDPLEKIVPDRVFERDDQTWISFEREDGRCEMAISANGRFYVDEIFFIEHPRELFDHWPPETWDKIAEHRIEPGMSEYMATFALGAGTPREASNNGRIRVVEYSAGEHAGVQPVSVRFVDGNAESITPLEPDENAR